MDIGQFGVDGVRRAVSELEATVYATEPGALSADSETVRLLELYLHWLPVPEQRQWFADHGEALRRAVFG